MVRVTEKSEKLKKANNGVTQKYQVIIPQFSADLEFISV